MNDQEWMQFLSDMGDLISQLGYEGYRANFGELPATTIQNMPPFKMVAEWVSKIENAK